MLSGTILFSFFHAKAQSSRNPTPAEKAVIEKFVNAIAPLIQPYANSDWELREGGQDDPNDYSVQTNPDVVMGVAPFSDYEFDMMQGTPLWNKEVKPLMDSLQHLSNYGLSPEKMGELNDRLSEQMNSISTVFVSIIPNMNTLPLNPVKGSKRDLKIPGCYFSYYLSNNDNGLAEGLHGDQKYRYILVLGDWSNPKPKNYGDDRAYEFQFKHPLNSPYIENAVIVITGNKNRIKELVQQTDWTKVNAGLTR